MQSQSQQAATATTGSSPATATTNTNNSNNSSSNNSNSSSNGARHILQIYVGALSAQYEALSVEASKATTAEEIVSCIVERLILPHGDKYELAEVAGECKERRLSPNEKPVSVMLLWPQHEQRDFHRFYLRETQTDSPWRENYCIDPQVFRDFIPFLLQPDNREYPDLCQLPDLNDSTLLENLRQRFDAGHIYTYVGSILIAVNPFKFHPIYNPKYVRLYQNQRVGPILPPHIFAIADNAYYSMLKEKRNQCVVISGESGSGKTESTNFLLHHLTALSQKGLHGSGVEQTILSAGPVLEAFGNAKTAHNNNSSRFGKFIQVNYRENGMVQGAVVQKYLLEKSRIVSQGPFERNYHVFYYLLSGATDAETEALHLLPADKYCYLNAKNLTLENCDEKYEFSRLKQSMEMVGFSPEKQRRLFTVLSAVLLLGNVEFFPKKSTYHHDESVQVRNLNVVALISELLKVKQDTLLAALTSKRVKASGETLVMQYKLPEAIAARDALAKCLYGALFDWIVLQVNHALLNKDHVLYTGHSIGVLDIFGFEDFGSQNSFEQLCINYANEHLQYYFNLHVFKYEQNEYKKEGIKWRDIDFLDNSGCLQLFEVKPTGLLCVLDDLCNFPGATNETLLQKFNSVHKDSKFYEKPQKKENAFIVKHYAGKVKYQVAEMREKNLDLMRQDIVSVLKNSSMAFVRELVGADPVAVFRWAIIRAFFRGYFAFRNAGAKHRKERNDLAANKLPGKNRFRLQNDMILSHLVTVSSVNQILNRIAQKSNNIDSPSHRSSAISSSSSQSSSSQLFGGQIAATNANAATNAANHPLKQRKWSSIAYNNKNFPDGKLGYEHQYGGGGGGMQHSAMGGNAGSNAHGAGAGHSSSGSGSQMGGFAGASSASKLLFGKGYSKFEHSGQEAMARASQIVQKNKSFRPGTRPKKGLKNLQTVKTLTAGQNLCNPSTVKTRKQPLTVTAQFQNSLAALMDTLNQANPFFIRCIKSNPDKIPNKFDQDTVTRQLRYTGMLETVRIRQAGYNVRLTYEEFIQLYRILLPKGLVSSQKDVRDFMSTMNLNMQHYQLGVTKIYMRESEKISLDLQLHRRIIASIVSIQRWFRTLLERRKFKAHRAAAICIQSYWRHFAAQREHDAQQKRLLVQRQQQQHLSLSAHRRRHHLAAAIIQSYWRTFVQRRWFVRTRNAAVVVQAHIRGKLARIAARERLAQAVRLQQKAAHAQAQAQAALAAAAAVAASAHKDHRYPLRPTQSLPANDARCADVIYDPDDVLLHAGGAGSGGGNGARDMLLLMSGGTGGAGVPVAHSVDSALDANVQAVGAEASGNARRSGARPGDAPGLRHSSAVGGYSVSSSSGLGSASSSISTGSRHADATASSDYAAQPASPSGLLNKRDVLHKAETQFRSLMISSTAAASPPAVSQQQPKSQAPTPKYSQPHHFQSGRDVNATVNLMWLQQHQLHHQQQQLQQQQQQQQQKQQQQHQLHDYQNMSYGKEPRGGRGLVHPNDETSATDSYGRSYEVDRMSRRGYPDEGGHEPVKRISIKPFPRRSESVDPHRHSATSSVSSATSATAASSSASSSADHLPTIMYSNQQHQQQQHLQQQQQQMPPIERAIARISHNNNSLSNAVVSTVVNSASAGSQQQHHQLSAALRRELVCRSTGDELTSPPSKYTGYNFHTPQKSPGTAGAGGATGNSSSNSNSLLHSSSGSLSAQNTPTQQQQQSYSHHSHSHSSAQYSSSESNLATSPAIAAIYTPNKAAAVLGTITENLINPRTLNNSADPLNAGASKPRRIKHNASADSATSASAAAAAGHHHHQQHLHLHHNPNSPHPQRHSGADSLRRRNSDPNKVASVTLLEANRGNDMYQSSTHINIAGHRFHKATRISKAEKCASCMESDAFVNEGHRCMDCKVLVHTKCIQNGGVKTLQCEAKRSKRLRKNFDKSMGTTTAAAASSAASLGAGQLLSSTPISSKYQGTREYTDSADKIISDAKELQHMQDFITQKICKMDSDCGKPSEVDRVFKQALREFKKNLVTQYSVAHRQNADTLNIKYKDLIINFEHVIETCSERGKDFPLTMGVNAFRGFLNEFMSTRETEKPKAKRKKEKKRKVEEHTSFNGHTFQLLLINIPTACEICQLFLMWPIERGLVCQNCRLTCHKKCYQKSYACNKSAHSSAGGGPNSSANSFGAHNQSTANSTLFGIPLTVLCATADGGVKIPTKIDQLITKIEMHGLYTEGLYRKSGVNSKIKELKSRMSDAAPLAPIGGGTDTATAQSSPVVDHVDLESYNVHVLANVLKAFLREMPEPLLSFDRYDDFLRASELSDTADRVSTLMSLIKKLPPAHHALLERLVFHLALVAQREKDNRMSASSLAIVFAPCVLRTNRQIPAQDSLNDIGRQTKCMETLITQKMLNVKSTLADIDTLDTAAHEASSRLTTIRRSKVFTQEELLQRPQNAESETEEMLLEDHIQEIKKEKAMLTSTLPSLARANSDDDLLSTDLDGEGGSLDDLSGKEGQQQQQQRQSDSPSESAGGGGCDGGGGVDPDVRMSSDSEPVAVSYNLREQNIDYIQQTPPPRLHQHLAKSAGGGYPAARWSGSQQNLHYSANAVNAAIVVANQQQQQQQQQQQSAGSGGSELQRQKPLAVRSMSGGYDGAAAVAAVASASMVTGSLLDTRSASAVAVAQARAQAPAAPRRQSSLDDEPIMV